MQIDETGNSAIPIETPEGRAYLVVEKKPVTDTIVFDDPTLVLGDPTPGTDTPGKPFPWLLVVGGIAAYSLLR